jgi:hypothetical protein
MSLAFANRKTILAFVLEDLALAHNVKKKVG